MTSSSSEVQEDTTQYQVSYRVDKTGGGTLSAGNDNGKTTLTYSVGASQSVSVTAVPASGHVFVKWSDGVTNKTRTDANFKQNLDVTAVFAAASVQISSSGKAAVGGSCTFHAKISGKYLEADSIRWYANGVEAASAAGQTSVTVPITAEMQGTTFKVYAVVSYNGSTVTSNTLEITVPGAPAASSGSSSSSSDSSGSSSSGSTASSGSSSTSSGASSGSTSGSSSSSSSEKESVSSSNGAESTSSSHSGSSSHSSSSSEAGSGSTSHSSSAAASSSHSSSESSSHSSASSESPAPKAEAENDTAEEPAARS